LTDQPDSRLYDCRDAFVATLESLAEADPRIVVLCNDSVSSTKLVRFAERFPDRCLNVGIAEQAMVGMAAGLAIGGKVPFVAAAGAFLTGRALEQIKNDLAYTDTNVKLYAVSTGLAYGALGATHHSIEDIAWLRAIANMTVIVPADPLETAQAATVAAETHGPIYLRISRMGVPAVHGDDFTFQIGRASHLRDGHDVTLIACGTLVCRALAAAELLAAEGIQARVLNMATLRPIDREAIMAAAHETGAIVTVEEHTVHGGLGSAVAEVVVQSTPVPMRILGVPGVFAPTGSTEFLFEHFGLTAQAIAAAARELVATAR
jgi:transketolase